MDDYSDSFSEVSSPGCLDQAFSLSDSVYLFEHSVSTIVTAATPETPSPQVGRSRRHHSRTEKDVQAAAVRLPAPVPFLGPRKSKRRVCLQAADQPPSPGLSPRRSKRRKADPAGKQKEENSAPSKTAAFVPASSPDRDGSFLNVWLEPCQPSTSSSSSSSCSVSSSLFSAHGAASTSEGEQVSVENEVVEVDPCGSAGAAAGPSNRDRRSSKTDVGSLSFLTAEERAWLGAENPAVEQSAPPPPEEILISDNEDDSSHAMVRIAQMEEDEVMAKRMQEQFDREQEEPPSSSGSRQHHHHHHHHMEQFGREAQSSRSHQHHQHDYHGDHHSHMFGMLASTEWTPPWLAAVQMAALAPFLHGDPDLLAGGQRRGRGARRGTRQRRAPPQLFDGLPGNDYEALLDFEERQGTVVAKKTLSKSEINRFPTKKFDSAQKAANTRCQICFCDYTSGEDLRILSCFHDYHVECIDKWLKVNATCPVCRCNMAEGESLGGQA